tara:strand:+ start:4430 stop:5107 length:678 start_codon:yes stop_codon:yes gene_type:complete
MKESWKKIIDNYDLNSKNSSKNILSQINEIRKNFDKNIEIYPDNNNIFRSFNFCEFNETKVVIIGQDPYHGPQQATGLAFGVNNGCKIPPSLRNIINEVKHDIGIDIVDTSLESWAKQGVLLLNSSLSVIHGKPGSQMKMWSEFTDYIIEELNKSDNDIIFVAWGAFAHNKLKNIDLNKHSIIVSSHPSPLSCFKKYKQYPEFVNSKPFSKINNILQKSNITINW